MKVRTVGSLYLTRQIERGERSGKGEGGKGPNGSVY